jgi:hypothetical protein
VHCMIVPHSPCVLIEDEDTLISCSGFKKGAERELLGKRLEKRSCVCSQCKDLPWRCRAKVLHLMLSVVLAFGGAPTY